MSEDTLNKENTGSLIDLSELQALDFSPAWDNEKTKLPDTRGGARSSTKKSADRGHRERRPRSTGDRRGSGAARGTPNSNRNVRERGFPREQQPRFEPIVDIQFFPDDIAFKALCHAMRSSGITYELFEIARLILAKPERFILNISVSDKLEGSPKEFYCSVIDGLPFLTERGAIAHVMKHHMERFFNTEEVEVEPPKGNFTTISRCGFTGELLGPSSYHLYQSLLKQHHATKLGHLSFDRFVKKIETVKDEEVVQSWLDKMKKVIRYQVKEPKEGEETELDGFEAASSFLLNKRRDQIIRQQTQSRISGRNIEMLAKDDLRRSIALIVEKQQYFPLETVNNIRGRLRRMRFTIYKRGAKNISYVCAVKRRFRDPGVSFSSSIQGLIQFIEQQAGINVAKLAEAYLGIKRVKKDRKATPDAKAEMAPAIDDVPREEAEKIVEKHEIERSKRLAEEQAPLAEEQAPLAEEQAPLIEEHVGEHTANPLEQSSSEGSVPTEEDVRVGQMMMDLHWLVSEGYVIKFGDGSLNAVPVATVAETPKPEKVDS